MNEHEIEFLKNLEQWIEKTRIALDCTPEPILVTEATLSNMAWLAAKVRELENELRAALLPFAAAARRPGRLLDPMTDQPLPDDAVLSLGVKVSAWRRANELTQ